MTRIINKINGLQKKALESETKSNRACYKIPFSQFTRMESIGGGVRLRGGRMKENWAVVEPYFPNDDGISSDCNHGNLCVLRHNNLFCRFCLALFPPATVCSPFFLGLFKCSRM